MLFLNLLQSTWHLAREIQVYVHYYKFSLVFLNQACATGFLKLLWFARQYVCLSLCPPPRVLITSVMEYCGIDRTIG